ncbi:MAG: HEPN domain-containing protein [Acidobacteriota bacterium]|nr:HEPN domain-containing protein [Acidobacteriota bacterium]
MREAKILFANGHYEGAYYLLGYAVECAFKACIAKRMKRFDIPDRKLVNDLYTHDLNKLLAVAELKPEYDKVSKANPDFELNWTIVKDWSEQSRYTSGITKNRAKDFQSAVLSRKNGILPWLQKWW